MTLLKKVTWLISLDRVGLLVQTTRRYKLNARLLPDFCIYFQQEICRDLGTWLDQWNVLCDSRAEVTVRVKIGIEFWHLFGHSSSVKI